MHINDFKRIVTTFADPGTEILFEKTRIVIQVNGDLISPTLSLQSGEVFIDEGSGQQPGSIWILNRLAHFPLLAARLAETVPRTDHFVSPAADLLPSLESKPDEVPVSTLDALSATLTALDERSPMETTVLYVTSDAGEGKTSLINELARAQAERYGQKQTDWLLVPIPLGGRHFLRFDDITVGALQNRYRFPFLYYNSFLALVGMGVIVPAFDGFEEMFVESSSGEALSAMGILLGALDSKGALVVAARKAYFEFENLKTQEKLYDTIGTYSVGFGKLQLQRWSKEQFLAYCAKRGVVDAEGIYSRVCDRLGHDHSLLTRAVLVRRLVDIAMESPSLEEFLGRVHSSGSDFFSVFVRGIIEREAHDKWIDRSGEIGEPLLTVDEHCELLGQVALAMWEARVDYMKREPLEFIADYYTELKRKTPQQAGQIRDRIRGHALLVPSTNAQNAVEFDHEEFRSFFLGEAVAELIKPESERAQADVLNALRKGVLPRHTQHAIVRSVRRRSGPEILEVIKFLSQVCTLEGRSSYTQENGGATIARLLSGLNSGPLTIDKLSFAGDALRDRAWYNVSVRNCFFAASSLETSILSGCEFIGCHFAQLTVYESTKITDVSFDDTVVDSLTMAESNTVFWDPTAIRLQLEQLGIRYKSPKPVSAKQIARVKKVDEELAQTEKLVRYFMRSTHISEGIVMMKLGGRGRTFIDNVLPVLVDRGALVEIDNRGGGSQRRFRLGKPLEAINESLVSSGGSFQTFLKSLDRAH